MLSLELPRLPARTVVRPRLMHNHLELIVALIALCTIITVLLMPVKQKRVEQIFWGYTYAIESAGSDARQLYISIGGHKRGVYKSDNAGATWRHLSRMPFRTISVSPYSPDVLSGFSGSWNNDYIYTSTNGGTDWKAHRTGSYLFDIQHTQGRVWMSFRSNSRNLPVISTSYDQGENWYSSLISETDRGNPSSIAVNPADPNIVYVGGFYLIAPNDANSQSGFVYKSTDGGNTWNLALKTFGRDYVNTVLVDTKDPERIFCGTDFGLYVSGDAGGTWRKRLFSRCVGVFFSPGNAVYVCGDRAIFRSDDRGRSWNTVIDRQDHKIMQGAYFRDFIVDELRGKIIIGTDRGVFVYRTML